MQQSRFRLHVFSIQEKSYGAQHICAVSADVCGLETREHFRVRMTERIAVAGGDQGEARLRGAQ